MRYLNAVRFMPSFINRPLSINYNPIKFLFEAGGMLLPPQSPNPTAIAAFLDETEIRKHSHSNLS